MSATEIDDLVVEAVAKIAGEAFDGSGVANKPKSLAATLHDADAITAEMIIESFKDGEVRLFVDLMSAATEIRQELVMRFLVEPGGEGLAVACRVVGMNANQFQQVYMFCRQARPQTGGSGEMAENALHLFSEVTDDMANEVVERWQRDPGYLSALRELGLV